MIYRKPTFDDIETIFKLINDYAAEGVMLSKSRSILYETIREMIVAVEDGKVIGVGALHVTWNELAEVRSMAVDRDHTRRGIGGAIVRRLIDEGKAFGVKKFFTLTYKPGFFQTLGFRTITKDELPHKIWRECIDCPKFPNCDEIAMEFNV
ncbi:MAG: N-acetyltransferase [Selenomonadaceae bacterium]|nr:N-acetyltransferase [Selenomonadaceae bacterium]